MKRLTHQSGFTLIELLMSAVIFASVALLTTSTLISTLRLQAATKQNQYISISAKSALDTMEQDILRSAKGTTNGARIMLLNQTHNYGNASNPGIAFEPDDTLLALAVPQRALDGTPSTTAFEIHVYCAELQVPPGSTNIALGKRVARYVLPYGAATGTQFVGVPTVNACLPASIQTLYNLPSPPVAQYLTDQNAEVINLRFSPVWSSGASTPPADYMVDPAGVRIELSMQYNPFNTLLNTTLEQRASDQQSVIPPLVLRALVSRSAAYTVNAQP